MSVFVKPEFNKLKKTSYLCIFLILYICFFHYSCWNEKMTKRLIVISISNVKETKTYFYHEENFEKTIVTENYLEKKFDYQF